MVSPYRESLNRNEFNHRAHGGAGGHSNAHAHVPSAHAHVPSVPGHPRGDGREQLNRSTFDQRGGHPLHFPQTSSGFNSAPTPVFYAPHQQNLGNHGFSTSHTIHVRGTPTAGDRRVSTLFFAIILGLTIAAATNFSPLGIGVALFVGGIAITRANKRHDHDQMM